MRYEKEPDIYEGDKDNRFVLGLKGKNPFIVFGVNPSTADNKTSDRTISKVIRFAKQYKCDGWIMLNIYPQRSKNPSQLDAACNNTLHQTNLRHIAQILAQFPNAMLCAAWGTPITQRKYLRKCLQEIQKTINANWKSIGSLTKNGHPRHPSRLAYSSKLNHFDINNYLDNPSISGFLTDQNPNNQSTTKNGLFFETMIFLVLVNVLLGVGVWLNWPPNLDDSYSIGGQLISSVLLAGVGIWITTQEWKKRYIFVLTTVPVVVLWNFSSSLPVIECSNDVMFFQDATGRLLSVQNFAEVNMFEELSGYNKLIEVDGYRYHNRKKDPQHYDQNLIAVATLSWMSDSWRRLDWSGCKVEPPFIGLSGASTEFLCDPEQQGKEISLQDHFGDLGKDLRFFLPPDTTIDISSGSNVLELRLDNPHAEITFSFSKKFTETLQPHNEGTTPKGIEENISRLFKKEPQPLSDIGFRVNFKLRTKRMRRWSEATKKIYQKRGYLFCEEYEKRFSWKLLQQRLESAFKKGS